jgi:hypothetical protein
MFCPQCKTEYRPGFSRCADCGSELVDALPEETEEVQEREGDNAKLVAILETMDQSDVVSIRMALDGEGIEYFLQGDALSGFRNVDPVVLLVREDDAARVRELLKGVKLNYSRQTFNPKKRR